MEHYTWQQIEREMKIDNFKRKVKEITNGDLEKSRSLLFIRRIYYVKILF